MKTRTQSVIIVFALLCTALLPSARAISPAPDGCYPNFTTAEGCDALSLLSTGAGNTALGWRSLFLDSTGNFNTGIGGGALVRNNGDSNTAVGAAALLLNTSGTQNTAVGTDALVFNDSGESNTADGAFALFSNIDGFWNTAVGESALFSNTTGDQNTATGQWALLSNDHGADNTANGYQALVQNTGGTFNVAVGDNALFSNTSGSENTAVGSSAGSNQNTGTGNVYIGDGVSGVAGEDNHTYIRNINFTSVNGGNADSVTVDLTTGLLGHASSSRRYKEDIKPIDNASEALYRLNPVTYCYKKEIDPTQSPAFGLIAEEVAQVSPALVARNTKGQPESVHYEMVNAMLLNEFLKEHRAFVEEQRKVAQQQREIDALKAELREQRELIQKVSDRVELKSATSQLVAKDE